MGRAVVRRDLGVGAWQGHAHCGWNCGVSGRDEGSSEARVSRGLFIRSSKSSVSGTVVRKEEGEPRDVGHPGSTGVAGRWTWVGGKLPEVSCPGRLPMIILLTVNPDVSEVRGRAVNT